MRPPASAIQTDSRRLAPHAVSLRAGPLGLVGEIDEVSRKHTSPVLSSAQRRGGCGGQRGHSTGECRKFWHVSSRLCLPRVRSA